MICIILGIRVVPEKRQRERGPDAPECEQRDDKRGRQCKRSRHRTISREPPRRCGKYGRDERRIDGEEHEIREPSTRDAAREACLHAETDRIANAGHRNRIADQQQHQRERMVDRAG